MSRAMRRQQAAAATKDAATKPGRLGGMRQPRPTRGARPPAPPKRRLRLGLPHWLEDITSELKKVSWPSREETVYLTTVVIIVAVAVGILLGLIDVFFNWLVERLLLG